MTPSATQDEQSGTPTPRAGAEPSGTEPTTGDRASQAGEPAQPREPADSDTSGLDLPKGSAESALMLQTKSLSGDKNNWIILDDVTFKTGATDVSDTAAAQLSNVAQVLEKNPTVKIELGAFTDASGSARKNLELSKERAESVRQALIDKGVDASRIEAKGYGETNLLDKNDAKAEANRRVAVRVVASR